MAKPDVRVRLSAEGVAEVVSALKRVQAEGERASQKQARGFGGLNRVLGTTTNLLGGLGIALGVHQFTRFIGSAIEAADQINKLGAKVGATTEHLSALSLVARTADADLNQVGAALVRMNKFVGDAAAGIPTAVAGLKDLGLTVDDFAGKDSVEIFELISKRITELQTAVRQGRSAVQIFGRAGANLLPTMKALADEGLGNVIKRAEELGVLIDHDLAAAAEQIKDDVEILKMQGEALGTRFIAGFGPQMSQALQAVSGDLKQTTDAWQEFGQGVGIALKWVVAVVGTAFDAVGTAIGAGVAAIVSGIKQIKLAVTGQFDDLKREQETFGRFWSREWGKFEDRVSGRFELAVSTPPKPEGTAAAGLGEDVAQTEEELAELSDRRAKALQAALDRELTYQKKFADLRLKGEKRALEEGLQDLAQYYADRRRIAEEQAAEELRVLEEKEALVEDITDPGRQEQERAKIALERRRIELEHANEMAEIAFEEREAVRENNQARLEFEERLLEMQGKRIEAQRLGFDEQIRQLDEILRKQGVADEEREAALERFRTALEAGADFEEAKQNAESALDEIEAARGSIDAQVQAGLLSQVEAEEQILELERSRIETLGELAAALEEAALATGDPEKIQAARDFAASITEIELSVEAAGLSFEKFKTTAIDQATSSLAEFLDTGIEGSKSLKDAFRDMVTSIVASLKRMAAELLAVYIMQKLTGLFGWAAGGGGGGAGGGGGTVVVAGGGLVRGPGTTTSDSIAARLSDWEFVTKAAVVRQPGVLKHLFDLNRRGARALEPNVRESFVPPAGFAEGGLVDAGGAGMGGEILNGQLEIGLEEGFVVRSLDSPAAQRVTIKTIERNRRAVRAALGL